MTKTLIIWTDKYSVGYDEIDSQHKKLARMINDLYASFTQGKADEIIENILTEMIKYTDYHFKTEEKYFEKYNYSETKLHKEQHQEFVTKVTVFYDDFKNGSITITYDTMNFLRDWLLKHIQGSDKKYSIEFKNKNYAIPKNNL